MNEREREKPQLSPTNLDKMCQHLEPLCDPIYKEFFHFNVQKGDIETFIREEEIGFSHNFDPNYDNIAQPNAYEFQFLDFLKRNIPSFFVNYLERKKSEMLQTDANWANFCGPTQKDINLKESRIKWIDSVIEKIKQTPSLVSNSNFTYDEVKTQLGNMKFFLDKNVTKIDFFKFTPREFKCFSFWLQKLYNRQPGENPNNKIYYSNININANILMNPQQGPYVQMRNAPPMTPQQQNMLNKQQMMYNGSNKKMVPPEINKDQKLQRKPTNMQENTFSEENFWERMVNLAENPYLNDNFIKEIVKTKKMEKRKSENPIKEGDILTKKIKTEENIKNFVIINRNSNGTNVFVEFFKEILGKYEETFRQNLLNNLEKFRMIGYSFKIKKALIENGFTIKLFHEQKIEFDFLKILVYPNTILINDCKTLRELEIMFTENAQNQDLGMILKKWEQFSELLKPQKR